MQSTVNLPRREAQQNQVSTWFLAALLISLGVHSLFYFWSKATPIGMLSQSLVGNV